MDPNSVLTNVAACILGLVVGGLPIGCIIVFRKTGIWLPDYGSSSAGSTNAGRALTDKLGTKEGKRWELFIQILDQLKGTIPIVIAKYALHLPLVSVALLGCSLIIGHTFSIFLNFKGGKGVATTMGVGLGLYCPIAALTYIAWYAVKKYLQKETKEATAIASGFAGLFLLVLAAGFVQDKILLVFYGYAALHILVAHHANWRRYRESLR